MIYKRYIKKVSLETFKTIENSTVSYMLSELALQGAFYGNEISEKFSIKEFNNWLENRFKYQLVFLDRTDYYNLLLKALWFSQIGKNSEFSSSSQFHLEERWFSLFQNIIAVAALKRFLKSKFSIEIVEPTHILKSEEQFASVRSICKEDRTKVKMPYSIGVFNFTLDKGWFLLPEDLYKSFDIIIIVKNEITRLNFNAIRDANFNFRRILRPIRNYRIIKKTTIYDEFNFGSYIVPTYIVGFVFQKDVVGKKMKSQISNGDIKNKEIAGIIKGKDLTSYIEKGANVCVKYIKGGMMGVTESDEYLLLNSGMLNSGEDAWGKLIKMCTT